MSARERQTAITHRRGTFRTVDPAETWSRLASVRRDCGISRVADITGLDDIGIPTFQAVRPRALTLAVSQGKGVTPMLARVSATMESVEFHYAEEIFPDLVQRTPEDLPDLGYAINELQLVPRPLLSVTTPLDWVAGREIRTGRPTHVPHAYVRLSNVVVRRWTPPSFIVSTNGLASGNTASEAVLHGLCEAVERDALAGTGDARSAPTAIEPSTVSHADARQLLDQCAAAGAAVRIFALHSRVGLPCYRADIWSDSVPLWFSGWGCHLDGGVALCRAVTEAAQGRLTSISGSREDLAPRLYEMQRNARGQRRPDVGQGQRFEPEASHQTSIEDAVLEIATKVEAATGREPIAVSLTPTDYPVAVVKVVTPGLHFDPREPS